MPRPKWPSWPTTLLTLISLTIALTQAHQNTATCRNAAHCRCNTFPDYEEVNCGDYNLATTEKLSELTNLPLRVNYSHNQIGAINARDMRGYTVRKIEKNIKKINSATVCLDMQLKL